jgi:Gas vesicle protein G
VSDVGLLSGIVLLPLAPLRGTIWLAEKLAEQAERELDEETTARRLLLEAEIAFETGALSLGEYEQIEDELLERLELARSTPEVV